MLLRLVPPTPLPTILFTLSFPSLPQSLPLPAAWDAHLQLLVSTDLAAPPSLHALDKSVAWSVLLDTVTFDLVSLTVACTFIDGVSEEWPLTNRCVELLEGVIRDVNRSAAEAEAEYALQRREPALDRAENPRSGSHVSLPGVEEAFEQPVAVPQPKAPKPKKRRSFLVSLMASLVPSSTFSGLISPARAVTPPPAPVPTTEPSIVAEVPELLVTHGIPASRFLRRRARSTLVDAFRRFVVGELGARFRTGEPSLYSPYGRDFKLQNCDISVPQAPQYALWVARSTMRRVAEEMTRIIEYTLYADGAAERDRGEGSGKHGDKAGDERGKDDDKDGDDARSASSTTDGSSVHTPLDFHDMPSPYDHPSSSSSPSSRDAAAPHNPTPLTAEAYHAYVSLKAMHHRLHNLTIQLTAHAAAHEQAVSVDAGSAEVRSRRRAWSARQYLVGLGSCRKIGENGSRNHHKHMGGASMAFVGLAVPVRPSPLCRSWNAEDLEAEELKPSPRGRRVRWEKELESGDVSRRARSLSGGQGQRGRCIGGMGKSREAEDVNAFAHGRTRVPRPDGEPQMVYSTEVPHRLDDDGDDEQHDDDDDDDDDDLEDEPKTHQDNGLYEKRDQTEFILHPTPGATSSLRPWLYSQLRIPQSATFKAALPSDMQLDGSIPVVFPRPKLHPTMAVDDYHAVSVKVSDLNSISVVDV